MLNVEVGSFKIEASYDEDKEKFNNKVTWNGEVVDARVLNDIESKKYLAYQLIRADLVKVKQWAELNIDILKNEINEKEKIILTSLFTSIIITYWKCFAKTEGREGIQLSDSFIKNNTYENVHDEIKRIRHNYIAHSGVDPFEQGYMLYCEGKKDKYDSFTLPIWRKASDFDTMFCENIIKLVNSILKMLDEKQAKRLRGINKKLKRH